jgi:hypothetical protein
MKANYMSKTISIILAVLFIILFSIKSFGVIITVSSGSSGKLIKNLEVAKATTIFKINQASLPNGFLLFRVSIERKIIGSQKLVLFK